MVYSFADLEDKYVSTAVTAVDDEIQLSGRIKLAGKETAADLETNRHFGSAKNEDGFFDLELKENGERRILLHKAFVKQSGASPFGRGTFRQLVFPNFVILDSQNLAEGHHVQRISFRIKNLDYFFWYECVEWHHLGDTKKDFVNYLELLRKDASTRYEFSRAEDDYDFTSPDEIYIVHRPPTSIEFTVGGVQYGVFMGMFSKGGAFRSVDLRHEPIATITFPQPVSLNEATTALWRWKRFFNQLAGANLELLGVSVCGSSEEDAHWSDVYLTNERWSPPPEHTERDFHPSNTPLSNWSDRERFQALMVDWLSGEDKRHRFRVFVDSVIGARYHGHGLNHISMLCAAIDSLSGLKSETKIGKKQIANMTTAAHEVAPGIPKQRIQAALGLLSSTSLRHKIESVASRAAPDLDDTAIEQLSKHAKRLRNLAAHGMPAESLNQPLLHPVCDALLALCILYDQELAGLDTRNPGEHTRLLAREQLSWSMRSISMQSSSV